MKVSEGWARQIFLQTVHPNFPGAWWALPLCASCCGFASRLDKVITSSGRKWFNDMINIPGLSLNRDDAGLLKMISKEGEKPLGKNKLGCGIGKEGGLEMT